MRHASERWYTASFNASLASPRSYKTRRSTLAALLRQHLGTARSVACSTLAATMAIWYVD